jgi:hypothetical protein
MKKSSHRRDVARRMSSILFASGIIVTLIILFIPGSPLNVLRSSESSHSTLPAPSLIQPQSYVASRPGAGCDTGKALWDNVSDIYGQVQCLSDGLQITGLAGEQLAVSVEFTLSNYSFPANYKASVNLTQLTASACGGIETRSIFGSGNGYLLGVCRNGSWIIERLDATGAPTILKVGSVAPKDAYHIGVEALGTTQGLEIDGSTYMTVNDSSFLNTDCLLLSTFPMSTLGNTKTSSQFAATFSNFVYDPLS